MSEPWAIEGIDLVKRYGSDEPVRGLTFHVAAGQVTGLLGRNGAGKSTTIRMLLGMVHPTSGVARVLGRRIDDPDDSREIRRRVAYVAEDKQLYPYMTVEQMIRFTRSFYADWRPDLESRLLKQYSLPSRRLVKSLSKGMRTKLALLLALSRRPALLILDEPNEGLDPVSIEELLQEIVTASADGATVFFSSHQISEIERVADRVCVIDRGRLALDLSMDEHREEMRIVTLGFAMQAPAGAFTGPNVTLMRADGRQLVLLARGNGEALVERARSLGALSTDIAPATLRDVFLAAVKGDD